MTRTYRARQLYMNIYLILHTNGIIHYYWTGSVVLAENRWIEIVLRVHVVVRRISIFTVCSPYESALHAYDGTVLYFAISQGTLPWQPIKVEKSANPFVELPFWNRLQYHNSDFKILNRKNLYIVYNFGDIRSISNSRDCEGNNCTLLNETAKIGISDRISQ